jgi:formylglycine-generating enzyme required for sulfatase activity
MKRNALKWCVALACCVVGVAQTGRTDDLVIQSFDATGQMVFHAPAGGTDYNYRVEWAPSAGGPWSAFGGSGAFWLDTIQAAQGSSVTAAVPMCYRVVATSGEYLAVDLSGGPEAASYPVTYYQTLADVPGGPNSDSYKTAKLLMRLIPKGVFTMGSPTSELGRASDETQHLVTLTKDYYIGVFEVTQAQWERVMGTWPSYFNNTTYRDSRPVELVSYVDIRGASAGAGWPANNNVDADSFMGRLRAKTGLSTMDLPTESQWEYACRAGTGTALSSGYNLTSTGSDPRMSEVGRYYYNHPGGYSSSSSVSTTGGTAKAGSYLPNAWGLYDMHGNVWEWCLDWYGTYPGTVTDPAGAASGSDRVRRVGGCDAGARYCRSANRRGRNPSLREFYLGLRLSMTMP